MKKTISAFIIVLFVSRTNVFAQNIFPSNGAVGIGTTTPDASSLLEINSTSKGLLIPRMSKSQRDLIGAPATGLMIYQNNSTPGFYYYSGTAWTAIAGTKSANTSLSNLTATSINQSLMPAASYIYNLGNTVKRWGDLYAGNGDFGGNLSGADLTYSGSIYQGTSRVIRFYATNTSIGIGAYTFLAGSKNTAIGDSALVKDNNGASNTATGVSALKSNTDGSFNTASGVNVLQANITGYDNTASGFEALYSNTTGSDNTANGIHTLAANKTGNYNSAIGYRALNLNETGNTNVASGSDALNSNFSGNSNVAMGASALFSTYSSGNLVAVGDSALFNLNGGTQSVAVGSKAGYNTKGNGNSYFGYQAGYYDNASYNTAVGTFAGWTVANANGCTYLGYGAGPTTAGFVNTTGIGYNVTPTASNQVRIGNDNVTSIGGKVSWTTFSDGRFKRNIKENVPGLLFINMLKPITYTLDVAAIKRFKGEDAKDEETDAKQLADATSQDKILHTGFVAQEVEAVAKKLNYDFDGVDAPKNDKDPYGIRYAEFVVPLVKAVQELSKANDNKDAKIDTLEKQNATLQQQFNDLRSLVLTLQQKQENCSACSTSSAINTDAAATYNVTITSASSLLQNVPNPFKNSTSIEYILPKIFTNAQIVVTDKNGKTLLVKDVSGSGKGKLNVNASILASGAYQYSLLINNRVVATKQMLLVK